ncbi:HNH endonuclease signature motif containing protein [Longispora sp. K20-0274]|uniref:HNH endonuclease signature motif containing protein n=1 Tax=Longispora sp. K20-0274 TaxID=3088255 RepID=UPI00399C4027
MPEGRPPIPADLERAVKLEAGYRCAIPRCGHQRTQVAHIKPYRDVRSHEFDNLIALCPNHHDLYDRTKEINRKALLQIKANLAEINGRYGELERRVLDHFVVARRNHRSMHAAIQEYFGEQDADGLFEAFLNEAVRQGVDWNESVQHHVKALAAGTIASRQQPPASIELAYGLGLMLRNLLRDGYLKLAKPPGVAGSTTLTVEHYQLTSEGEEFVDRWSRAQSLEFEGDDDRGPEVPTE